MKKLLLFPLLLLLLNGCKKENLTAREGELCFAIKGADLVVTNQTAKTVHFNIIDTSILTYISRMPMDCTHFNILEPGGSKTFKMDELLKNGRKPLSLSWWQCEDDKITDSGNKELPSSKDTIFCTKL